MSEHSYHDDSLYSDESYFREECKKCGAYRYDCTIGWNPLTEEYKPNYSHVEYNEKEYDVNFPCLSKNEWIIKGIIE